MGDNEGGVWWCSGYPFEFDRVCRPRLLSYCHNYPSVNQAWEHVALLLCYKGWSLVLNCTMLCCAVSVLYHVWYCVVFDAVWYCVVFDVTGPATSLVIRIFKRDKESVPCVRWVAIPTPAPLLPPPLPPHLLLPPSPTLPSSPLFGEWQMVSQGPLLEWFTCDWT